MNIPLNAPSSDAPDHGTIRRHGEPISRVESWWENGLWIIRSTEFDCYAEAEDHLEAVERFGETAEDLIGMYEHLAIADELTLHEAETLLLLLQRFHRSYQSEHESLSRVERKLRIGVHRRRSRARREPEAEWAPQQTLHSSTKPSLVS